MFTPYTKLNSMWSHDLNGKSKNTVLSKDKMGGYFYDFGKRKNFSNKEKEPQAITSYKFATYN